MSTQSNGKYADICSLMMTEVAKAEERVRISEENLEKRKRLLIDKEYYDSLSAAVDYTVVFLTNIKNDTNNYLSEKNSNSLQAFNAAIAAAASVVPDSGADVVLRVEEGEAWLETSRGLDVDVVQGSGYRGVSSALLRSVALRLLNQYNDILIFDEPFAKLSVENSANLAEYLPILAQDAQVFLIEQKKEVCPNENCTTFTFFLDDNGHTVVTKEKR